MWAPGARSGRGLLAAVPTCPPLMPERKETGQLDFRSCSFFWLRGTSTGCVTSLSLILLIWEMEVTPSDLCHGIWKSTPVWWVPESPVEGKRG